MPPTARGDEGKPALAFSRKRHALIAPLSRASVEQMQEAIDSRRGREAPARPLAARCHGLMSSARPARGGTLNTAPIMVADSPTALAATCPLRLFG